MFSTRRMIRESLETVGAAIAFGVGVACFAAAVDAKAAEPAAYYELVATHEGNAYVLDSDLSGHDCTDALETVGRAPLIDLNGGRTFVTLQNVRLACELAYLPRAK